MQQLDFSWIPRKPWSQVLSHKLDYYQFFQQFKRTAKSCYLFESLEMPRHQDRYYSMGFNPAATFTGKGRTLQIEGEANYLQQLLGNTVGGHYCLDDVNPYQVLRDSVGQGFASFATGHQGGLIGYFCYETINCIEPCLALEEHQDFSLFKQGLYLDGLLFDSTTYELTYYSYEADSIRSQKLAQCQLFVADLEAKQAACPLEPIKIGLDSVEFKGFTETKAQFINAVESTRRKIADGFSFQAEVGFKSLYGIKGDKFAIYNRLRQINPSPYMFYLRFDNADRPLELLGSSPEILLSQSDSVLLTTPAAGTTHRGKTPQEDADLGRALLSDQKEIAEHNMLVDLHRNDIAKVSIAGSVKVSDLMYLIKFSHVQHIASNVIGLKKPELNGFDTLASVFPGGVVTGAPKIETMKIIDENEHLPRGPYGGAVGRMSLNGDATFCLAIRSLFCAGDDCFVQTSAGIVYDSEPEKEFQETCNKLAAMKQVLEELGDEA
mgnify:CR=1 FL=1